jgi:cytochrome c556
MSTKPIIFVATAFVISTLTQGAQAQSAFAKPAQAVAYRQGAFQVIGSHAHRLGGMAKGDRPFDKVMAENDAAVIDLLARQLDGAFPPGSDIPPSKGKPEIWQDVTGFKQKMEDLKMSAGKLSIAARSGDINLLKAAYNSTAQTCKACHDGFRNR